MYLSSTTPIPIGAPYLQPSNPNAFGDFLVNILNPTGVWIPSPPVAVIVLGTFYPYTVR
jgi:hypothetical protein